ncbi:MAG: hypothetical protein AAGF11_42645 [Myxococcota bacterium]
MNGPLLDYDRLGPMFDRVVADGQQRRRAALDQVRANLLQARAPEPARRAWWPMVAAPALLAAALLIGWWWLATQDLSYTIDGEQQKVGLWISADQRETNLEFSNGAKIVFRRGTKGRVTRTTTDKAQLLVESGQIWIHGPAEGTRWSITTGPYELEGTGTDIELQWLPEQQLLHIDVREGSAELRGPAFEPPPQLRSGESLHVREGEMTRRRAADRSDAEQPDRPAPSMVPPEQEPDLEALDERGPSRRPGSSRRRRTNAGTTDDWRALARREDYAASFGLVEGKFDTMIRSANAADLMRLADVARFSGHSKRATEALLSFRKRFSRHRDAATAAYTLGLIRDSAGSAAEAERWFATAVKEKPRGRLHRSALGRLIKAAQQAGHSSKARAAAQTYLERYPDGPHAELAERIGSQ